MYAAQVTGQFDKATVCRPPPAPPFDGRVAITITLLFYNYSTLCRFFIVMMSILKLKFYSKLQGR